MVYLATLPAPIEGIKHEQSDTSVNIDGTAVGNGTMFITESCVVWRTTDGKGFSMLYPEIGLHAVSRDLSSFPQECLYLMYEGKLPEEPDTRERQESSSEEEEENDPMPTVTEIRFVPSDKTALDPMFSAMSACQILHPDEQDTDSEAEEEADNIYYEGDEGVEHLTEQGQATLQHLENLLITSQGGGEGSPQMNGVAHVIPQGNSVQSGMDYEGLQVKFDSHNFLGDQNGDNMDTEAQFEDADDMDS